MNRTEARALWQRVATGDLERFDEIDTARMHAWIREVAAKVVEADALPTGARPDALVRALGLAGKVDAYADLRALVNDVRWEFPTTGVDGAALDESRAQIVRQMVALAREQGLLRGVYADDDKKAHDLIRSLLPKQT